MSDALPGTHESLWTATATVASHAPLPGDIEVDVVVVGGGVTGLTTALLVAETGRSVAVVEARRLGGGTTGGTTGKVTSQHSRTYHDLIATHGRDVAQTYADANQAAIELVAELIARHGIDADFERTVATVFTVREDELPPLEQEVAAAQGLGLPATLTADTELPFPVAGAMEFADQAQYHPMRYLAGLAAALGAAGGRIFEGTRAHRLQARGDTVVVETDRGRVQAEHAVIATLLPFVDRGFEFARTRPVRAYGIAARVDEGAALRHMHVSAGTPTRSLRRWAGPDGEYLVVVGESHETGHGEGLARHYRALIDYAHAHFPITSVDYRWSAQDYTPADGLPYIGKVSFAGNAWVATGFRKWGLTNGTVAARIIADGIAGQENDWAPVFDANRVPSGTEAFELIKDNLHVARRFVAGHLQPSSTAPEDLAPGQGAVMRRSGRELAVSRGADGSLSAVSAVCSHLGCVVAWNDAEASWDCPCHGSRFARTGEVLDGPATRPLKPQDL
jgi:glycine/D-amino acid oxidase-like deaminating enzyme/nitrite reductase/ring-hydroxylating ferredoxin subunit